MIRFFSLSFALAILLLLLPGKALAQSVKLDWLRQAGISCGGGLAIQVQGEIDSVIIKKLKLASIEGEGVYNQSHVISLLEQFSNERKEPVFSEYVRCLLSLMKIANDVVGLPPREVVLSSPVAVAGLDLVSRGDRFVMVPGDVVAVRDYSLIFTVISIGSSANGTRLSYTFSNSETGRDSAKFTHQAEIISLGENCVLVPYKVDAEPKQVSLLSNC
ncbi:hypothetical protein [Oceaniovalibus sp. ACAM 378]|uniref:hypothetical protein n=1 Tax=Oceaniovalibus sp. ACAM 378 TaxID=2599923 RepID=UPI0011D405A5|nr:hypothetical protein [Oceaniovalibus sp. ACAM 378]TYB84193.1 hypothetical protein FQ320_22605 [Oceaniovalibus sp. ACAM 378]